MQDYRSRPFPPISMQQIMIRNQGAEVKPWTELPIELLAMIFERLDHGWRDVDLFAVRLTCRRWSWCATYYPPLIKELFFRYFPVSRALFSKGSKYNRLSFKDFVHATRHGQISAAEIVLKQFRYSGVNIHLPKDSDISDIHIMKNTLLIQSKGSIFSWRNNQFEDTNLYGRYSPIIIDDEEVVWTEASGDTMKATRYLVDNSGNLRHLESSEIKIAQDERVSLFMLLSNKITGLTNPRREGFALKAFDLNIRQKQPRFGLPPEIQSCQFPEFFYFNVKGFLNQYFPLTAGARYTNLSFRCPDISYDQHNSVPLFTLSTPYNCVLTGHSYALGDSRYRVFIERTKLRVPDAGTIEAGYLPLYTIQVFSEFPPGNAVIISDHIALICVNGGISALNYEKGVLSDFLPRPHEGYYSRIFYIKGELIIVHRLPSPTGINFSDKLLTIEGIHSVARTNQNRPTPNFWVEARIVLPSKQIGCLSEFYYDNKSMEPLSNIEILNTVPPWRTSGIIAKFQKGEDANNAPCYHLMYSLFPAKESDVPSKIAFSLNSRSVFIPPTIKKLLQLSDGNWLVLCTYHLENYSKAHPLSNRAEWLYDPIQEQVLIHISNKACSTLLISRYSISSLHPLEEGGFVACVGDGVYCWKNHQEQFWKKTPNLRYTSLVPLENGKISVICKPVFPYNAHPEIHILNPTDPFLNLSDQYLILIYKTACTQGNERSCVLCSHAVFADLQGLAEKEAILELQRRDLVEVIGDKWILTAEGVTVAQKLIHPEKETVSSLAFMCASNLLETPVSEETESSLLPENAECWNWQRERDNIFPLLLRQRPVVADFTEIVQFKGNIIEAAKTHTTTSKKLLLVDINNHISFGDHYYFHSMWDEPAMANAFEADQKHLSIASLLVISFESLQGNFVKAGMTALFLSAIKAKAEVLVLPLDWIEEENRTTVTNDVLALSREFSRYFKKIVLALDS